jgi:hypothetical protein|uniref:Uncharacterized protein n=1 Tax=Picea glauca TaxID=3330 RepID=A0A117NFN9_PICGL|nr:hypothetical protein ABT39_MTgene2617 [Picea glauca]QHR88129.1 hypothetical protein Q903MT_gene2142 [Picea sitchensis]
MKMAGMKQPHPSLLLMDVVTHYLYTLSPIPQLNEALKRYHHFHFSYQQALIRTSSDYLILLTFNASATNYAS